MGFCFKETAKINSITEKFKIQVCQPKNLTSKECIAERINSMVKSEIRRWKWAKNGICWRFKAIYFEIQINIMSNL